MKAEKKLSGGKVTLSTLDDQRAWDALRPRLDDLERNMPRSPWCCWDYFYWTWKLFLAGKRVWLAELTADGSEALLAAGIWVEEFQKRKFMNFRVLRSMDHMAFRLPPFLARQGQEELARRMMSRAMPFIARTARADMMAVYRLERASGLAWAEELRCRGVAVKQRLFTLSPRIEFGDDFEAYKAPLKKRLEDILRRERRMIRENSQDVQYEHVWGGTFNDEAMREGWETFQSVRNISWQHKWIEDSHRTDPKAVDEFYRRAAGFWADRGWTCLQTLKVAGKPAAAQLWLAMPGVSWLIIFSYDQSLRKHGVGNALFFRGLEQWHARGGRRLEFGGECLGWKADWANRNEEIYQLEFGLGSLKARLWSLLQRIRPPKDEGMVRTGRENEIAPPDGPEPGGAE